MAREPDAVLAQSLFEAGRDLMAAGRYDEACAKLAESQRIDPAGGTLLNLARCHELQGRLATAWAEYKDALGAARRDGRPEREQEAEQRLAELEPRLPRLQIIVGRAASIPRFELTRNGVVIRHAAWGEAVPVDPGAHRIEATAPGYRPWTANADVTQPGVTVTVRVPSLVPIATQPRVERPRGRELPASPDESGRRWLGWSAVGLGAVGMAVGTFYGLRALDQQEQADAICDVEACPPQQSRAVDLNEDARRDASISTISYGAGLVCAGIGVFLLLEGESSSVAWHTNRNGGAMQWSAKW